jgi:hypothetical protein
MTKENKKDVSKKLSDVLDNIGNMFADLGTQIQIAFHIGREDGFTDIQIGDMIRTKLKGIKSLPTIRRMLPDTAIHKEKARHDYVKRMNTSPQARLVTDEQPAIPPPSQVVVEANIDLESEEKSHGMLWRTKVEDREPKNEAIENVKLASESIIHQEAKILFDYHKHMDRRMFSDDSQVLILIVKDGEVTKVQQMGRKVAEKMMNQ